MLIRILEQFHLASCADIRSSDAWAGTSFEIEAIIYVHIQLLPPWARGFEYISDTVVKHHLAYSSLGCCTLVSRTFWHHSVECLLIVRGVAHLVFKTIRSRFLDMLLLATS